MDSETSALGQLLSEQQVLIGCPEWCQWAATRPRHEHSTTSGAELVVEEVYDADNDQHDLVVLEVRHLAS